MLMHWPQIVMICFLAIRFGASLHASIVASRNGDAPIKILSPIIAAIIVDGGVAYTLYAGGFFL